MYQIMIIEEKGQKRKLLDHLWEETTLECRIFTICKEDIITKEKSLTYSADIAILHMKKADHRLIKMIKQNNSLTQVIVIARESDWQCVKAALQAGADEYLVQADLCAKEFDRVLHQALQRIRKQKREISRRDKSEQELLRAMMIGAEADCALQDAAALLSQITLLQPYRKGCRMAYVSISAPRESSFTKHAWQKMRHQIESSYAVKNDGYCFMILPLHHDTGIILFQSAADTDVSALCRDLLRSFSSYGIFLTLSEPCSDLSSLLCVFKELLHIHEGHFYASSGMLLQADGAVAFHPFHRGSVDFHDRLCEALNIRDYEEIGKIYRHVMSYMAENCIYPKEVLSYAVFLLNNMERSELKKAVKIGFDFQSAVTKIPHCRSLRQLDRLIYETLRRIEEWLKDEESDRYGKDITDVILFVEENCTEKITLHMLAERFNVNESYLSRMFKKQTGKNLIYFINEMKMGKAKELLSNPDMMVKEAAYALGYEDQFYFNKLFKRFYGTSPSKYRRHILEQRNAEDSIMEKA